MTTKNLRHGCFPCFSSSEKEAKSCNRRRDSATARRDNRSSNKQPRKFDYPFEKLEHLKLSIVLKISDLIVATSIFFFVFLNRTRSQSTTFPFQSTTFNFQEMNFNMYHLKLSQVQIQS